MEKDPIVSTEKSEVVQQLVEQEIDKQNERLFADQNEIDGRVLADSQEEIDMHTQEAIDNLNAAKTLNACYAAELESIAQKDMGSQLGSQKKLT